LAWLLGGAAPTLQGIDGRILESCNPRATKTYLKELDKLISKDNLDERLKLLVARIAKLQNIDPEDAAELNEIDRMITQAKLEAERQCGKLTNTPWSPKLKQANYIKRYWETWLKENRTGRDLANKRRKSTSRSVHSTLTTPSNTTLSFTPRATILND
jgi:hypothetical protein